jgi:2-(1,2-epoxy-1,2-dihydrophenyl)acetyl-CoA isomerase
VTPSPPVLLRIEAGIAEIRLNRPDRLNAFDVELALAFHEAVETAVRSSDVRAVLVCGEGRSFSVGGDLALLHAAGDRSATARDIITPINAALSALQDSGVPSVAALQGPVAGGGMSLALCTDLAVAAADLRMRFAYVDVAASPDCGGSWALPRLVGLRKAIDIALLGPTLDSEAALQLGLVNVVTPRAELDSRAREIASRIARLPVRSVARTLGLLRRSAHETMPGQLAAELDAFAQGAAEPDFDEGLRAFLQKRPARFRGGREPSA